jgi:hypothetical protein
MEENSDAGALIEEDYYTFFNISRDVSYTNNKAQYGYQVKVCVAIFQIFKKKKGF